MPASIEQQWKPEEDALLKKLITEGISFKDMPDKFPNRTRRGLTCRAYTLGLKSGTPRTIHSKDESFWETPNPINSYYAGLAAADMSLDNKKHTLSWGCEVDDEKYMQFFIDATKFTGTIFRTTKINKSINGYDVKKPISIHSNLRVGACQKWSINLENNFNIIPNKTYRLRPPNLKSDYLKCCYLIGLFDGDGALSHRNNVHPLIAYGSASKDIVEWVREFIESRFPFKIKQKNTTIQNRYDNHYYRYNINGMTAVKVIELFRTIDVPKFTRKWDNPNILQIIEQYKVKWPKYFTKEKQQAFNQEGNIVFVK